MYEIVRLYESEMHSIKETLGDDPITEMAGNIVDLQNDTAELKARLAKQTVTLDGLAWESTDSGLYTQAVTAPGVTAENEIAVTPLPDSQEAYIRTGVMAETQAADSITFTAVAPEDVDLLVKVVIMNI